MDSIQEIIAAVTALVLSISIVVARYKETSQELGWFPRLLKTFDLSQIFDSTRKLGDK